MKELQHELENKANDLRKLQKGKPKLLNIPLFTRIILISTKILNPILFNCNFILIEQILRKIMKSERSTPCNSAKTSSSSRFLLLLLLLSFLNFLYLVLIGVSIVGEFGLGVGFAE